MLSKDEIKKWLLENCVDEDGDLYLSDLDFSDFDGDVFISFWKVKNTLWQACHAVGGHLFQDGHDVKLSLFQGYQRVGGEIFQQIYDNEEVSEC